MASCFYLCCRLAQNIFLIPFYLFFFALFRCLLLSRCENCKLLAPTLLQIEEEYSDQINFVMINGDTDAAWPLIEAFGVDAIPHLALVEADGTVDTALIGPVPKQWLERDLQVLIENAKTMKTQPTETTTARTIRPLPYQMLDVFANRPEERRIQVQTVSIHPE